LNHDKIAESYWHLLANAGNYGIIGEKIAQKVEDDTMANTTALYARIDSQLKNDAESILAQLGISPAVAIQMLYSQIVLMRGMPFEARLPYAKPLSIGSMSRKQLDDELAKGIASMADGTIYTAEEVDAELAREFGI
jgi:addiction module RelB/DinJ family antitoxin